MKVGFVIQHYPPYLGGAECQARDLAEALVRRGHELELATTRWNPAESACIKQEGLTIRRWITPPWRWLKLPWNLVLGFAAGWRLSGRCEVLHGHCLSPFVLGALLAAHCRRRPMLVKICSMGCAGDIARIRRRWLFGIVWRIACLASGFLVPSRAVGDELRDAGIKADIIYRVPSLFPQAALPKTEPLQGVPSGEKVILFVGRLHPDKGLRTMMEAWPALARRSGWQWLIVGEGPLGQDVHDWVQREGLQGSVKLLGYQEDPGPWFERASLFVFPSHSETFGNVLVEALLHGCQVLTTEVGVVRDWPQQAPVVRLPAQDPAAWERAVLEWIESPEEQREQRCKASRSFALEQHHPEVVLNQLEALYASLSAPARSRGVK